MYKYINMPTCLLNKYPGKYPEKIDFFDRSSYSKTLFLPEQIVSNVASMKERKRCIFEDWSKASKFSEFSDHRSVELLRDVTYYFLA